MHRGTSPTDKECSSAIGALFRARVDHLMDYRTEYFEARARQITGRPAIALVLGAIGGGFAEEGPSATRADR